MDCCFAALLFLISLFFFFVLDDIGSDEHTDAARLAGESRPPVQSGLHSGRRLTAGL